MKEFLFPRKKRHAIQWFLILQIVLFSMSTQTKVTQAQALRGDYKELEHPVKLTEPIIYTYFNQTPQGVNKNAEADAKSAYLKTPRMMDIESPDDPGEVAVEKTVEPVSGMTNLWEITLRIEGKDVLTTSDIVLVLDRSGSMSGSKLASLKLAAEDFVNTLLVDGGNVRIALVSFAAGYSIDHPFAGFSDKSALLAAINGLSAAGGTHTQAGMHQGQLLFDDGFDADIDNIVLLSDGQPTYSHALDNPDNYLSGYILSIFGYETTSGAPQSAYLYADPSVGNGSDLRERYAGSFPVSYYYNNGNSAIAEAGYAKDAGTVVYTIALEAGTTGTSILNQMASPGKNYDGGSDDLDDIFTEIAGDIQSAARETSVQDAMGTGFTVPGTAQSLSPSQGTAEFDSGTNSIEWEIGTLTEPISPGSDIKYAELTYQLVITDDILNATPDGSGNYSTNGNASVSYIDIDGNPQTIPFDSPQINPVIVTLTKTLYDENGQEINDPDLLFTVNFSGDFDSGDMDIGPGETKVVVTVQESDDYIFTETGFTDAGTPGDLSDYVISYFVDSSTGSSFPFYPTSPDQELVVENRPSCELSIECPDDITVECDNIPSASPGDDLEDVGITVNESCSGTPYLLDVDDVQSNEICENSYTITRTFTVLDDLDGFVGKVLIL